MGMREYSRETKSRHCPFTCGPAQLFSRACRSAQEAGEVLLFPRLGSLEPMELALPLEELLVVHEPPTLRVVPVRHDGMEHLVIDHVLEKPCGNECLIQERMDADHAVLFLDGAEDDVVLWPLAAPPPPLNDIATEAVAEVPLVHLVEDVPEIKVPPL